MAAVDRIATTPRRGRVPTGSTAAGGARRAGWAAAALALLAAYLLSPALTSTHVEGFTAALQLDAIAANRHLIDRADLLYPIQTEYLYLTRQGVVLMLRGLMALTGSTGDGLFRGLMLASFAVFLAATVRVARRHARLGWHVTLGSLLLLPGLFELAFFFSDGLVAVAFGIAGLALLPRAVAGRPNATWWLRAVLAGLALGIAALCRADALLLLPLALGLASLDTREPGHRLALCAAGLAGLLLALATAQALSGTSLWQALQVGHFFDTLHANSRIVFVRSLVFVLFFGLPGLAFVAIGAVRTWRSETRQRRLVLLGLPGLVLLYALRGSTEARQVYPYLAPFAVVLCGRGLQWLLYAWRSGPPQQRRWAVALAGFTLLVWLAPPVFVPVKDGPRAVFGRLWSPPMWWNWQGRVAASLDDVDALLARAERLPRLAVITAHFNTDHFLQLRAWQRGWLPLRPSETADRCAGGVEVWRKGGRQLIQLRLDNTYGLGGIDSRDYVAVHLHEALACAALHDTPTYVSDFWPPLPSEPLTDSLRVHLPAVPVLAQSFAWPPSTAERFRVDWWRWRSIFVPLQYGVNRSAPLSAGQLAALRELAASELASARERADGPGQLTMRDLLPRFRNRYWQMPVSPPPVLVDSAAPAAGG